MSNYQVQALPPTIGIKDPDVRMFLDALVNAWDHRSGNSNPESPDRFITAKEFDGLASNAVATVLGAALPAEAMSPGSSSKPQASEVIQSLSDQIKRGILYQVLGTAYGEVDIGQLQRQISVVVDEAEAALSSERTMRVSKDNALASAINTMWSAIGGDQAVIQDGELAAVSPSAAQAQKWQQVQAAVTDPNTGQVSETSIKQEILSYANKADGTLNSIYSVRAQITRNGRTVVGGFGLAATDGAGSGQGPTIDFGVRADTFWIGDLSGQGDLPFVVQTVPTTVNGSIRPAGVYLKDAFIGTAAIDTLTLAGNSVTVPVSVFGYAPTILVGIDVDDFGPFYYHEGTEWASVTIPSAVVPQTNLIVVTGRTGINIPGQDALQANRRLAVFVDGSSQYMIADTGWASFIGDFFCISVIDTIPANAPSRTYKFRVKGRGYVIPPLGGDLGISGSINIFGAKR